MRGKDSVFKQFFAQIQSEADFPREIGKCHTAPLQHGAGCLEAGPGNAVLGSASMLGSSISMTGRSHRSSRSANAVVVIAAIGAASASMNSIRAAGSAGSIGR